MVWELSLLIICVKLNCFFSLKYHVSLNELKQPFCPYSSKQVIESYKLYECKLPEEDEEKLFSVFRDTEYQTDYK